MNYIRPPITESVVEFRFADETSFEVIQKRVDKFKRFYPQETHNVEFTGEMSEKGFSGKHEVVGVRLASKDELQILMINKSNFIISQLAPYPGWSVFSSRVARDLDLFTDVFGRKKINRIGVRYINRLDIPLESLSVDNYLNVWPALPYLGPSQSKSFALQSTQILEEENLGVTLQSATVDSPVPKAESVVLDIDIFTNSDVPMRNDAIVKLLDAMRTTKNKVFEASITDKARELFA